MPETVVPDAVSFLHVPGTELPVPMTVLDGMATSDTDDAAQPYTHIDTEYVSLAAADTW